MTNIEISAETSALRIVGMNIKELGNEYLTSTDKLYNEVNTIDKGWQGDDSDEYVLGVRQYEANIRKLGEVIVKFGDYLVGTSSDYEDHISSIKSSANKLFNNI